MTPARHPILAAMRAANEERETNRGARTASADDARDELARILELFAADHDGPRDLDGAIDAILAVVGDPRATCPLDEYHCGDSRCNVHHRECLQDGSQCWHDKKPAAAFLPVGNCTNCGLPYPMREQLRTFRYSWHPGTGQVAIEAGGRIHAKRCTRAGWQWLIRDGEAFVLFMWSATGIREREERARGTESECIAAADRIVEEIK